MWTRNELDVLWGLKSESVDLVHADPPFNSNKNYEARIGSKAGGAAVKVSWRPELTPIESKDTRPSDQRAQGTRSRAART